ncbi:MAG: 50S ribosomal protein L19 [Patescibacteria group bacterium]|nr:50S ribosomal protein L19 [Patescibacteria group bacterium]
MKAISDFLKKFQRTDLPEIRPGMIVKVFEKIDNDNKVIPFEGLIIKIKNRNSINKTFTVRGKVANQYIEKTYFYNSPVISKIEIISKNRVRRAKLYFVREISEHRLKKKLKKKN